jgi:hypothetical protein
MNMKIGSIVVPIFIAGAASFMLYGPTPTAAAMTAIAGGSSAIVAYLFGLWLNR